MHRCPISPRSAADGAAIADLPLTEDAWISLVIRAGRLVPAHGGTILRAGDEVIVLAGSEQAAQLNQLFTTPEPDPPAAPPPAGPARPSHLHDRAARAHTWPPGRGNRHLLAPQSPQQHLVRALM